VTDTQTDRQTHTQTHRHTTTAYTALSIASRGKNVIFEENVHVVINIFYFGSNVCNSYDVEEWKDVDQQIRMKNMFSEAESCEIN